MIASFFDRARRSTYGITFAAYLFSAGVTGAACVLFARGFDFSLSHRIDFLSAGRWPWLAMPVGFWIAWIMIHRYAPAAAGTGIPQAIVLTRELDAKTEPALEPVYSAKTLIIKTATLYLGVWVGASTGREGPTVHIAVGLFLLLMIASRKLFGIRLDLRSIVIAGGAAGLAAAFNTPLAGVAFAIEELSETQFAPIKEVVLTSIIVAGLTAKSLTGDYSYFGKLMNPPGVPIDIVCLIGVLCGLGGACFSTLLEKGSLFLQALFQPRWAWLRPVGLAFLLCTLAATMGIQVLGPGNKAAQILLESDTATMDWSFPLLKMAATLFTYWAGIAGGIFAPCLSIGAGVGSSVGHLFHTFSTTCAVIGMAAFLAGTIQAPITAFVIIFEMNGQHHTLLPMMLASLIAFLTARLVGAHHFYQTLADQYRPMIQTLESKTLSARQGT